MITNVRPLSRRSRASTSIRPVRPPASRPANGSSSTSTRGFRASMPASATRRCWPPLSWSTRRGPNPAGSSPTRRRAASAPASSVPDAALTSERTVVRSSCSRACWKDSATRPTQRSSGTPSRVAVPSVGISRPARIHARVDLPEPLRADHEEPVALPRWRGRCRSGPAGPTASRPSRRGRRRPARNSGGRRRRPARRPIAGAGRPPSPAPAAGRRRTRPAAGPCSRVRAWSARAASSGRWVTWTTARPSSPARAAYRAVRRRRPSASTMAVASSEMSRRGPPGQRGGHRQPLQLAAREGGRLPVGQAAAARPGPAAAARRRRGPAEGPRPRRRGRGPRGPGSRAAGRSCAVPPGWPAPTRPGRRTCPDVGGRPPSTRARVDLPDPFGPTTATNWPGPRSATRPAAHRAGRPGSGTPRRRARPAAGPLGSMGSPPRPPAEVRPGPRSAGAGRARPSTCAIQVATMMPAKARSGTLAHQCATSHRVTVSPKPATPPRPTLAEGSGRPGPGVGDLSQGPAGASFRRATAAHPTPSAAGGQISMAAAAIVRPMPQWRR